MPDIRDESGLGQVFVGRPKVVAWERLWAFSGGPFNAKRWPAKNIHTDPGFAAACGVPSGVAASATQLQGYVAQLMIEHFGTDWLSHGVMDVKFTRAVNAGDTVIARAQSGLSTGGCRDTVHDRCGLRQPARGDRAGWCRHGRGRTEAIWQRWRVRKAPRLRDRLVHAAGRARDPAPAPLSTSLRPSSTSSSCMPKKTTTPDMSAALPADSPSSTLP